MAHAGRLLDVLIVAFLAAMCIDGLPTYIPGIPRASRWLDPVMDVSGLEQTSWKLFAPDPDHVNAFITATITWDDGSTSTWESPAWEGRSARQRIVQSRWHKAMDNARQDSWRGAWGPFARWVATQVPPPAPGVEAVEVELTRHWWSTPRPRALSRAKRQFGRLPPAREDFGRSKVYHTERLVRGVRARALRREPVDAETIP